MTELLLLKELPVVCVELELCWLVLLLVSSPAVELELLSELELLL